MQTPEDIQLTMEIIMTNVTIKKMPAVLHNIINDIEKGISRRVDKTCLNDNNQKYSFETSLSPSHLVSKFFK